MEIMGIDIGGSGIKGAPVDTESGALLGERFRIPTPLPPKPRTMAEAVAEVTRHFDWHGPVGCGFPASLHHGVALTAANISKKWIGANAAALFAASTACPVVVINDADAAGLAEMTFGAGRGRMGVVFLITIGTGLGTALFTDGHLLPNTDLGHIEINGKDAELNASDAARQRLKLSWEKWAVNFNEYLTRLEKLFFPDLFILGGGASKKSERFMPHLTVQAEVVVAQLLNDAGIVGAALAAQSLL
jgi:polyphosphate glucokinase